LGVYKAGRGQAEEPANKLFETRVPFEVPVVGFKRRSEPDNRISEIAPAHHQFDFQLGDRQAWRVRRPVKSKPLSGQERTAGVPFLGSIRHDISQPVLTRDWILDAAWMQPFGFCEQVINV
jgi:hypothetical protein